MTADLQAQLAEAGCRHLHPTRWECRATSHPCDECAAFTDGAMPAVSAHVAQVREGLADEILARCSDSPERLEYTTANHAFAIAARIVRPSVGPREQGGGA